MHNIKVLQVSCLLLLLSGTRLAVAEENQVFAFDWQPPEFVATTADGQKFQYPGDLQGPTIVLFWATWCPYCKALMPHLQSIVDEYGDGIRVLALNFREDGDPVAYIERYGYQFMLFPSADEVADSWGVRGTPGLFLADQSGRVVFSRGAIPVQAYPKDRFNHKKGMNNSLKAARTAPFWAALLRQSLDQLVARAD